MAHPLAKWSLLGLAFMVFVCYMAPVWHMLFPNFIQDPTEYSLTDASQGPSLTHPFGTDSLNGHDIFSLVLYGGRLSLFIGIGSMIVAILIAIIFGSFAGFFGGIWDAILMRVTDLNYSIPVLITVPLASKVFGHADAFTIALIFGLFTWAGPARIVRSSFL